MAVIDTVKNIETPEGVQLQLRVAGPVPRLLAWSLDFFIKVFLPFFTLPFFALMDEFGWGLFYVVFFVFITFYSVLFEVLRDGRTPGKQILRLKVVQDNGTPVGWNASILRNLMRFIDMLPMFYTVGLISCLMNKDFKRLGDLVAGTVVVYDEHSLVFQKAPEARPEAFPIPLTQYEQHAVVSYAERSQMLSEERLEELANILTPITNQKDREGKNALYRYANWLLGRR